MSPSVSPKKSSAGPLYRRQRDLYDPTDLAGGPWSHDAQHGGPPSALLVRLGEVCLERERPGHDLLASRITIDLFRAIPKSPLRGEAELRRSSRRLAVVQSRLFDDEKLLAEATMLFLRPTDRVDSATSREHETASRLSVPLPSPETLESVTMAPTHLGLPHGFHFEVDTRWLPFGPDQPRFGAWVRYSGALVQGETPTTLQRLALVADFANAVSGRFRMQTQRRTTAFGFINCDCNIFLEDFPLRVADDGWLCLVAESSRAENGLGHARVGVFSSERRVGTVIQSSLAQQRKPATS